MASIWLPKKSDPPQYKNSSERGGIGSVFLPPAPTARMQAAKVRFCVVHKVLDIKSVFAQTFLAHMPLLGLVGVKLLVKSKRYRGGSNVSILMSTVVASIRGNMCIKCRNAPPHHMQMMPSHRLPATIVKHSSRFRWVV
jgi:hypothetical protein